jgi:hypothetical protein
MPSARERWFAEVLHAGLDTKVLSEQDILSHATPAVLTAALPRDVMVKVIEATLASGTMSHKAIIDVVSLELLAEKIPPNVVWSAIATASERGGIRDGIPKDEGPARELVRRTLDAGLKSGVLTAADVVQHVNAQVLVASMPEALTTKLIEASLAAGKMTPELIVDTLGVDNIAKHVSTKTVWSVFVKPGEGAEKKAPAKADLRPSLEFVDDDVHNVLVELEGLEVDTQVAKPMPKEDKEPSPPKQPVRPS